MKNIIVVCVVMSFISMSGCSFALKQAVRTNTEKSSDLAKVVYSSDIVDELKKGIVFNYASLRCMRDIMDKGSTADKDSEACACQRYGAIDFGKCESWFNK